MSGLVPRRSGWNLAIQGVAAWATFPIGVALALIMWAVAGWQYALIILGIFLIAAVVQIVLFIRNTVRAGGRAVKQIDVESFLDDSPRNFPRL